MAEQRLLAVSPNLPCAMDRQEWSLEDYHICRTLYNGYAAQVYTATCRYSGMEVVLKVYHDVDKAPDVAQHEMYREVAIQSGLQHPNVVHLFGAFEEGDTLVLVQEYVPNGDLLALMQNHGGRVDESTVVKAVMRPLLGALMYLHRWGIVHRDVKPENVLFAGDGSIKLADFGLAINMVEERPISRVGTLDYMAPEVLRCPIKQSMAMTPAPGATPRYGFATDVWAVGILTFELLTGLPPYASDCRHQAESRICSSLPPIFPHCISPMARDFILRALAPIPGDRPTVRQLLEHPWIVNPDACLAPVRSLHAYPYSHGHALCHQPQHSSLPVSQPATSAPLPAPAASQIKTHRQQQQQQQLQIPTAGYSSSDSQCQSSTLGTGAEAFAAVAAVGAPAPLSAPCTALSSPATSARYSPAHAHHQHQKQYAQYHLQQHPQEPCFTHAPAIVAGVASSSPSHSIPVDEQLRVLQQQQLLDLSKLPLDQIQGMIQKLQEAMQLAVVQHQQQMQAKAQQQPQQHQDLRPAGSGASAGDLNTAASRCSGGAVPPATASIAGGVVAQVAVAAAGLSFSGGDVQMSDVAVAAHGPTPDGVAFSVVGGVHAPAMSGTAVPAAAPSIAHSCSNSPQQYDNNFFAAASTAAAQQQPCRVLALPGSPCSAPVFIADAVSYASTTAGYGSLCASRRSTVEATPQRSTAAAAVAAAADTSRPISTLSPTHLSFVRHIPSPRGGDIEMMVAAATAVAAPLPRVGSKVYDGGSVPVLVAPMPVDAAAASAAMTPRRTCGGGGSQGGSMHEGDGLVYVSIGSSRKAAASEVLQCEIECAGGNGEDAQEAGLAAWMRQFGASS